jgi:hypothetical protein
VYDQTASAEASKRWMTDEGYRSSFWQLIDMVDRTRRRIAWTNVCKMDRQGGKRPPTGSQWKQVRDVCLLALGEEIHNLSPATVLFVTGNAYRCDIERFLDGMGYCQQPPPFDDGWTKLYATRNGKRAVMTRHPQGWSTSNREKVIDLVKRV